MAKLTIVIPIEDEQLFRASFVIGEAYNKREVIDAGTLVRYHIETTDREAKAMVRFILALTGGPMNEN